MTPLGTILRSGSSKPPKIDERSLFTSIQVSIVVLEGDLQVYEPWKKRRNRPKQCRATLYANETSPFLVWSKLVGKRNSSTSSGEFASSSLIPRCVVPVSRATLAKTTGGSFELTDFSSKLTFRFVAETIREADLWVEKLAEESVREANLDMRSIASSRSSFSSATESHSPSNSSDRATPFARMESDSTLRETCLSEPVNFLRLLDEDHEFETCLQTGDDASGSGERDDVFLFPATSTRNGESQTERESSKSRGVEITCKQQQHVRAQPHLGLSVALDKRRPNLHSVIKESPRPSKVAHAQLPLSEYFVHLPNS